MLNDLFLLALLSITATYASGEIIESTSATSSNANKIISLPLLNYGILKQRRMLEMGLDEDEMDSYVQSISPNDRQNFRRTSLEVGGLYQGYGTHYVDLWVGSPPQRQTVIVDTGSGVTAFPCSSCTDCGEKYHASTYFIEADSSTFRKSKCDSCSDRGTCVNKGKDDEYCKIGVSYQEGSSWTAYEAEDQTYLGGLHHHSLNTTVLDMDGEEGNHLGSGVVDEDPNDAALFRFPLQFGCQTEITGLFKTQLADGIMGMGIQKGSFWRQMYDAKIIAQQQFSLCFIRNQYSSRGGTLAGAVTMGGTDTNLHISPMIFADGFISGGKMHGVTIRKVYFMEAGQYTAKDATPENTHVLDISTYILNRGKVILDSGTTDTYILRDIHSTYRALFEKLVGVQYDTTNGMALTDKQVAAIPSLIIQLAGHIDTNELQFNPRDPDKTPGLAGKLDPENPNDVLVVVTPNAYFRYDSQKKAYFPSIFIEGSGTVLGANFMSGHDILFDIPENKRIGFAPSNCDYGSLVETKPNSSNKSTPDTNNESSFLKKSKASMYTCDFYSFCKYRFPLIVALISLAAILLLLGMRKGYKRYMDNRAEFRNVQEMANFATFF